MSLKKLCLLILVLMGTSLVRAQGTASAIFLLISPGARAGGMGEAQVAVANDSYASYWNPAGLAFQKGVEISGMHVNWLPGLVNDMYYDFLAIRVPAPSYYGVVGGHIIYLDAGKQTWTDDQGNELGTFSTYFTAAALSYATMLSDNSSIGFNFKVVYQHLADRGVTVGSENTNPIATSLGVDIGYLKRHWLSDRLDFGVLLSNVGPKVTFNDKAQADPMPTNLKVGWNWRVIKGQYNTLNLVYDVNKLLVASYPDMDWDGDGFVGGYDQHGNKYIVNNEVLQGDYNAKGQRETAHTDPWYLALVTSWLDDWYLGGDRDLDNDKKIGGYNADTVAVAGGKYNSLGQLEVGNAKQRSFSAELRSLVHNIGLEYWYNQMFAIRGGFYYDYEGKIIAPTLGIGLRYGNYGFDFGYIVEKQDHPLNNTMRFSLLIKF